ncbi:endonuclease III [Levilactobacillus zymae]|uniref:Endonuclease III n=1 Tax=Levilactobacillus zymae TaxID=267363 RepID=A0ABQ0WZK1_9LACO|nr:endonuclease III [Levilactobacillus zymae]KRL09532.1 endonuclease III-like protein [Levilactobacillus zymae DSM 19395]QFR62237.1 endonuclease III [Levilactobacillus zymae]GEO71902.1 endonuclease III [Levilactobacillus zymae]
MTIEELYHTMAHAMGPQPWLKPGTPWAETPVEIMLGAILVQNTNWRNVEPALRNLKRETAFEPAKLRALTPATLTPLIQSSGFYRRKAAAILSLAAWLGDHDDDLDALKHGDGAQERAELLAITGIGNETADYILMYTLDHGTFMVDTYARRLFSWLGATMPKTYPAFQKRVLAQFPLGLRDRQEFHALIDEFGKQVKTDGDFAASFLAGQHLTV